ncbi:MAG: SRPBCC domain-containing protein [Hyphomonadaceae bacterium]
MSATLADDELLITRSFDAPAALLYALWTEVEHFTKWMGPEGFDCAEAEIDFRVGGKYRGMIRSADHGDNWFGGAYREIDPPHKLVFTWKWDAGPSSAMETLVTITFREQADGKTVMTFHQTPFINVERRDSHVQGWSSLFNKLDAYARRVAQSRTE